MVFKNRSKVENRLENCWLKVKWLCTNLQKGDKQRSLKIQEHKKLKL